MKNSKSLNIPDKKILEVVQSLLEKGAECNLADEDGNTALHWISMSYAYGYHQNSLEIIDLLLRYGTDINKQNKLLRTPLMTAVLNGHEDIIEYLLEKGADSTIRDVNDESPISILNDPNIETN